MILRSKAATSKEHSSNQQHQVLILFIHVQSKEDDSREKWKLCIRAARRHRLTGGTCGGRRTGSPSLLHFQSAIPPAGNTHEDHCMYARQVVTNDVLQTVALCCGPVQWEREVSVSANKPGGGSAAAEQV